MVDYFKLFKQPFDFLPSGPFDMLVWSVCLRHIANFPLLFRCHIILLALTDIVDVAFGVDRNRQASWVQ